MAEDGAAETPILELVQRQVTAIRGKDVDGLVGDLAPGVVVFDVLPPLGRSGPDDLRERTAAWFDSYDGQIGYEVRDLTITAGDDVAFGHFLYHVSGSLKAGGEVDMWVRMTLCLRRIDSRWLITHEHTSVPFDATTGMASLDLKP